MQQVNARGTVQAATEIGYATVNWTDGPNTITVYPYDNSISQNLDTPIPYDHFLQSNLENSNSY